MTNQPYRYSPGAPLPRSSAFSSGTYAVAKGTPTNPAEGLVEELAAVRGRSTLRGMCEAGAIIQRIREAADYAHRPGVTAPTSFRQLANLPKMSMSAASLCRATAIYELWQRMPDLLAMRRIGVGHVSAILCLKEDLQEYLLRRAEAEGWTKARLQQEVDLYRYVSENVRVFRSPTDPAPR